MEKVNLIKIKGLYLNMDKKNAIEIAKKIKFPKTKTFSKWNKEKTEYKIILNDSYFMPTLINLTFKNEKLIKYQLSSTAISLLFEGNDFSKEDFVQDFVDNYFPGCTFKLTTDYNPNIEKQIIYKWIYKNTKNKTKVTLSNSILDGGVTVHFLDNTKFN